MSFRALLMAALIAVFTLAGCASFTELFGQRTPVPTPIPVPTPVPIATWVAQGIPNDLRITYRYESTGIAPDQYESIKINADGSASYHDLSQTRVGKLSAESLKRVALAFEENGFFFLESGSRGCVFDSRSSSVAVSGSHADTAVGTMIRTETEAPVVSVSIRINGISHTVSWESDCHQIDSDGEYDPELNHGLRSFDALIAILKDAVKDLPPGVAN